MILDKKSGVPLYLQAYELLKDKINEGEFTAGSEFFSENQLAAKCEISRMTARAALKKLEDEGYLSCNGPQGRMVNKPHEKFNLAPSRSMSDTGVCVGVYPFDAYQYEIFYHKEIIDGLSNAAVEQQAGLRFLSPNDLRPGETLRDLLERNRISGLIMHTCALGEEFEQLSDEGFPVLALNLKQEGRDYVTTNHYQGARLAVETLIHMGHYKVAHLGLDNSMLTPPDRRRAYFDVMSEHGLKIRDSWVMDVPFDAVSGWKLDLGVFKGPHRPTALFITGGLLIPEAMDHLEKMGLRVPDDVSVAAVDAKSYLKADVSGVDQASDKMASLALELLVKKIRGARKGPIRVETEQVFIPGKTCSFNKEILTWLRSKA